MTSYISFNLSDKESTGHVFIASHKDSIYPILSFNPLTAYSNSKTLSVNFFTYGYSYVL